MKVKILVRYVLPALMIVTGLAVALYPAFTQWSYDGFQNAHRESSGGARGGVADEPGEGQANQRLPEGAVAEISIPRIGLDAYVLSGTTGDVLAKGPGHYQETPLPGAIGNSAIAGHRTMYGHPFRRLDELEIGDEIITNSEEGEFTYTVVKVTSVLPTDLSVIDQSDKRELTLTTCDPVGSASQRLVVSAELSQVHN